VDFSDCEVPGFDFVYSRERLLVFRGHIGYFLHIQARGGCILQALMMDVELHFTWLLTMTPRMLPLCNEVKDEADSITS
jgi:hypothetical protein